MIGRSCFVAAALAFASVTAPAIGQTISAGDGTIVSDGSASSLARRLNMGIGKTVVLDLPRDAAEVVIGNPAVANAVVRSSRKLYVIGVSGGQTSIFAMDAQGRQIADV